MSDNFGDNDRIIIKSIEDEMKESYIRYSMSVIISRALPDVRDGLKPSQRRILFAMRQLRLNPEAKHRKCAKICGDTSGDYHPHGESVIYPTLVRMAQKWAMRYPLIDGQGNFGSVDGDPAAAMRYTEAKLTHGAVQLMKDLEKETVDLVPNYDETKTEPVVFPASFPNLLCNGSSGIAVGMATNIPPHNLRELYEATLLLLNDRETSIDAILAVMPGPDFPTGGSICGYTGIIDSYRTGRGKIILRGKTSVEDMALGKSRIVIEELPYNVNKSRLVETIADLIHEKTISGISDIRDESDKDGLRIVIELKRDEMPEVIVNRLYKFTDLQVTFGSNMLALDKSLPKTMNIRQMIVAWIDHRIEVVRRRTRFELNKAEARAHILEGLLKIIDATEAAVRLIKNSANREDAKNGLIEMFQISDRQAHAILELKLYQLTGLEHEKLQFEYSELQKRIAYYNDILASEDLVKDIIRDEFQEIVKTNGEPRKTQIVPDEGDFEMEDLIPNESVIITVSEDDYIKRMSLKLFKEQKRGGCGVTGFDMKKETDTLKFVCTASNHDYLLIFTNFGRCYWIKVWKILECERRSKGKPLINFLEDMQTGEVISAILNVKSFEDESSAIFMATKHGVVKKVILTAFSNPRRKGVRALEIDEGDELISVKIVSGNDQIMLFTYNGMAVRFIHSDVRPMGRTARGVRGVKLKENAEDRVVNCEVVKSEEDAVLVICENGFGKRSLVSDYRLTKRGGVGVRSIITSDRNGNVVGAIAVDDSSSIVIMSSQGQAIRITMKELRIMGRSTQGVRLVHLKEGDTLVAAEKLETITEETVEEEINA